MYYDIVGSTANELRAQLDALGPVGYDGYRGDATTRWEIHWQWPINSDGSCRLAEVVIASDIKVIFPRWMPPRSAPSELIAQWVMYMQALAAHEKGHVDCVLAYLPRIEAAVRGATCETANAAAEAILAVIRQHDINYDIATQHGVTQGARFPLPAVERHAD